MTNYELNELKANFELLRLDYKDEFKKLDNLRSDFVKYFTVKKVNELSVDEYITGKRQPTFCNRIENDLNSWGDIHGSNSIKFGLYYGKKGKDLVQKYRFAKKYGSSWEDAFINIKKSIIELLNDGKNENYDKIKQNLISPMFKGKILSIYYPDKYLNIFASSHLDHFITNLGLINTSKSEIDKQKIIIDFKNNDKLMQIWTIYEFSKFLYKSFNKPVDEKTSNSIPNELKNYISITFPPIEEIQCKFITPVIIDLAEKHSHDVSKGKYHDNQNKNAKKIGDQGELIVLKAEFEKLKKYNIEKKIQHIAKSDDNAGYDILSFDENGNEIQIEVKSTKSKPHDLSFIITSNELKKSREFPNYYLYLVFEAHTKEPEIWKIKAVDLLNDEKINIEPTQFRINAKLK